MVLDKMSSTKTGGITRPIPLNCEGGFSGQEYRGQQALCAEVQRDAISLGSVQR